MPEQSGAKEDGGKLGSSGSSEGTGSRRNNGQIDLEIGGEKRIFANQDELKSELLKLHAEASKVKELSSKVELSEKMKKLGRAAVLTGSTEAERQFYEFLGLSESDISSLFKGSDNDNESRGAGNDGRGGSEDGGTTFNLEDHLEAITDGMKGKVNFSHFDTETLKWFQEVVERLEASTDLVRGDSVQSLLGSVKSDKVIAKYWDSLNDTQRRRAFNSVVEKHGGSISKGRRPTEEVVSKVRNELRSFLVDTYGPADEFRKRSRSGVPSVMDIGASSTGLEELDDNEFVKHVEKVHDVDSDEGKGPSGLLARMIAAQERARRKS